MGIEREAKGKKAKSSKIMQCEQSLQHEPIGNSAIQLISNNSIIRNAQCNALSSKSSSEFLKKKKALPRVAKEVLHHSMEAPLQNNNRTNHKSLLTNVRMGYCCTSSAMGDWQAGSVSWKQRIPRPSYTTKPQPWLCISVAPPRRQKPRSENEKSVGSAQFKPRIWHISLRFCSVVYDCFVANCRSLAFGVMVMLFFAF